MKLSNYQQTNKKVVKNYKKQKKNAKIEKNAAKKNQPSGLTFWGFLKSKRMVQVYGILLMAFAVLLFIAMLSSYFHFRSDASFVVADTEQIANAAGALGAHLAYRFINYTFGFFSIGFVLLFFIYGFKLTFERSILPPLLTTFTVLITMAWFSTVFGCFFRETDLDFVSGAFGNQISNYLIANTQRWGAGLILAAAFVIILVLFYNISPKKMMDVVGSIRFGGSSEDKEEKKIVQGSKFKVQGDKEEVLRSAQNDAKKDNLTDNQKLPGLYAEDRNELRNEYDNKGFIFQEDGTVVVNEETDSENKVDFKIISMNDEAFDDEMIDNEKELEVDDDEVMTQLDDEFVSEKPLEDYDPRLDLSMYKFPELDLLNEYEIKEVDREALMAELKENVEKIELTLKHFGIFIKEDIRVTRGPTVTLYEIVPADGIRIAKIKNLEDDIALSLHAIGIRIIAPIPGKGTIGIEIPNKNAQNVSMKEIIASEKFQNNKFDLPIGLGKTISNEPFVVDLAKMPHLLIAGATGQGKSVGLNVIITSLLYKKHPAEMKFVLVDPKVVEFSLYSVIEKHYLAKLPDAEEAIITDTKKVIQTLNSLCIEMDIRYDLLKEAKTKNIKEYNSKFCSRKLNPNLGHKYLPYIVLVIDEFGDFILTAGREVELPISRLAQKARAVGIHLIFATQRPSVNIITGTIKANFPARLAFKVASQIDSKIILDCGGANQLIGRGDMLFYTGNDIIRLQCAFVDTPEVEKIAQFIEEQQSFPNAHLLPEYIMEEKGKGGGGDDFIAPEDMDQMFVDAATLIVQTQMGSTSLIQRKLKLGYNRAGRVMDQLEEFGIVGPSMGSKAREVKVKTNEELRQILQTRGLC